MLGGAGIFWRMWCGGSRRVPLGFLRVGLWVRGAVQTVGEPSAVTESQNGGGTGLQQLTTTQLSHRLSHHSEGEPEKGHYRSVQNQRGRTQKKSR